MNGMPPQQGLYDPRFEHDACGVGFVCHLKGKPSHQIVLDALKMLENMEHRGGCGCESDSGDGAGILVKIPDSYLRKKCEGLGFKLPKAGSYGVGMLFLSQDMVARRECEQIFEKICRDFGMIVLGWRDVPVDGRQVGPTPKRTEPKIRQVFVGMGESFYNRKDFERRLYLVRQIAENTIEFGSPHVPEAAREDFYICTLSSNRLVYKGMLTAAQLRNYYLDLRDPQFHSGLAMVHSPLLDQHLPFLAAGASVPDDRPQWRNQHSARQPQLDAGPRRLAAVGRVWR